MQIGDIIDEHGIDDDSKMEPNAVQNARPKKSRASRESRQLDAEEVTEVSAEADEPKRHPKSRASRESRQMEDDGYFESNGNGDEDGDEYEGDEVIGAVSS